jgi:flagellar biosynthesis chaperone FliJ
VNDHERRFSYRLDSLIKLRSAERDALSGEVARATREFETRTRERAEISRTIDLAESLLRALRRDGARMSVDEELRMQSYLGLRRRERETKQRELDAASRAMEKALAELQAKQRDAMALEAHRDRQRRRFDEQQSRVALNTADDQWLRKRGRS